MKVFLLLVVFMLLLITLLIAAVVWQIVYTARHWRAAERLASALGWKPVFPAPPAKPVWYGGVVQGRRTAIRTFGKGTARSSSTGRSRVSLTLRILMEVMVPMPLGVAVRSRTGESAEAPFSRHFVGHGMERLLQPAQESMLAFIRKAHEVGIHGLQIRTTPKLRDLKLADRASISAGDIHPPLLADARVLLAHDHPEPHVSPEELKRILSDLATVAAVIEQSMLL